MSCICTVPSTIFGAGFQVGISRSHRICHSNPKGMYVSCSKLFPRFTLQYANKQQHELYSVLLLTGILRKLYTR
jgi:hypothetical protein